jgi:flagellar hook-basal body complex protein FliE
MADGIDGVQMPGMRTSRVEIDPRQMRTGSAQAPKQAGESFASALAESIGEVQRLQTEADTQIKKVVSGEIRDVTDAMVAVEKADVAFQTLMQVRNRIVAAYEEIMRTQV